MNEKKSRNKNASPSSVASGFDGSGHMNPEHAQRLLAMAREGRAEDHGADAFIEEPQTDDDLAEQLAEAAVSSMTTGGADQLTEDLEAVVDEELGGPFTETSGNTEFAGGTDESNIPEATREPFPRS